MQAMRTAGTYLLWVALQGSPLFACDINHSRILFPFQGKKVAVDIHRPADRGRHPLIIMIHGSAGVFSEYRSDRENFGERSLAKAGFVTALIHYFDANGISSTQDRDFMAANAPLWIRVLRETLNHLTQAKFVDGRKIGIFAESLGGYLAAELAAQDSHVQAVSIVSGGWRPTAKSKKRSMPPLLFSYGMNDSVIPADDRVALLNLFTRGGAKVTVCGFAGAGHYLPTKEMRETIENTSRFFKQEL